MLRIGNGLVLVDSFINIIIFILPKLFISNTNIPQNISKSGYPNLKNIQMMKYLLLGKFLSINKNNMVAFWVNNIQIE